ncbi:MAG: glycine cleavage system aminomethyltransferase GcvT [Deltaproteobacteria bacterium]|nr:glycine cleavage system aminomethyltransferase GcvT [Deltaproteobacteria bacterium]
MAKRTPLYDTHRSLGARLVEFGGWEMPVQYRGILAEHHSVRTQAGLFDLSHMGEIEISGPRALEVCQELLVTDVARVQLSQAQYSVLCNEQGGCIDDVVVYRTAEECYLLCVNAANIDKDWQWIDEHNRQRATIRNLSDEYALVALQGPRAAEIVQPLVTCELSRLRRYWSTAGEVAGHRALIARTGYTGEDGFELFVAASEAKAVWQACEEAGRQCGLVPVGLGARDTLRLEAGLLLYGNDLDAETSPLEAGLRRLVQFGKDHFLGREALLQQQALGLKKQLIGLRMETGGIPRHGYRLWQGEETAGVVTSGTQSPTLEVGIALGYVPPALATPSTELTVEIRTRRVPARVVALPFYRREKE